jgi:hypothetical protein
MSLGGGVVDFLKFSKYNVSIILRCGSIAFWNRFLNDWTLVIKEYDIQNLPHGAYSYSNARAPGVFGCPDSIRAFSIGFEKYTPMFHHL